MLRTATSLAVHVIVVTALAMIVVRRLMSDTHVVDVMTMVVSMGRARAGQQSTCQDKEQNTTRWSSEETCRRHAGK